MAAASWDGTISSSDFCVAARAFAERWKTFNSSCLVLPEWSWVPCPKPPLISVHEVEGYLCLQNVFLPRSYEVCDEGIQVMEESSVISAHDEPIDDAVLVENYVNEARRYEFHVLYNTSYRIPVLYFNAYYNDGQPLALDDIEKDLSIDSTKVLKDSKWTFITQEEHPYLNRPWFTLHPCGTAEWMKLLMTSGTVEAAEGGRVVVVDRYLVSWFSVVGQVFGLKIPFEMLGN